MNTIDAVPSDLTDLALSGDPRAWGVLIAQHTTTVRRALQRCGVSDQTAADLTQDTWMHLMRQSERGRLSYLALPGLAIKQARRLDHARRRRAWVQRETASLEDAVHHASGDDVEHAVGVRIRVAAVDRALTRCSPRSKAIFLAYVQSTATEVSREFGISEQRVRQIACEVRAQLRSNGLRSQVN